MKLKYALAVAVISLGSATQAQEEPSYEETVAFLQSRLNTEITYSNTTSGAYRFIELKRCEFARISSYNFGPGRRDRDAAVDLLPLDIFDPSEVITRSGRVWLRTTNLQQADLTLLYVFNYRVAVRARSPSQKCENTVHYNNVMADYPALGNNLSIPRSHRYCYTSRTPSEVHSVQVKGILPPSNDNAPRVQRAMSHLIRLCGGREQLF